MHKLHPKAHILNVCSLTTFKHQDIYLFTNKVFYSISAVLIRQWRWEIIIEKTFDWEFFFCHKTI